MATNKRINTAELDFDDIKSNLKSYLQGQAQFADYDFEGSGLSVLLDILAYNTHYNALYTNLAVNESFLDSASKRDSVVSLAKNLGYRPLSATAPTATVDVRVTSPTSTPATLTIEKYTPFSTTVSGTTYNFYTNSEYTTTLSGSEYLFEDVEIKEGTFLQFRYTVADGAKYIIPNAGVDVSTITVTVQTSSGSGDAETYYEGTNLLDLNSTSKVYFLKETEDEKYELVFGDGVIGNELSNGNVITIKYLVTNADETNGASTFVYGGGSLAGGTVAVTTSVSATGGAEIEGIESIRYNAPRHYSTQNRGVTVEDYKSLINENVANVEAVNVWGGEDNDPPIYGKVFLSIKPTNATALTTNQKQNIITQVLKPKNVVSITPEIIDPEYIHIDVTTAVYYNSRLTTRTSNDIKAIVEDTIKTYNTTDLEKFDSVFRISKLQRLIDASENSILSNITRIVLHKEITPVYNVASDYSFVLVNPIYTSGEPEDSITSTPFYIAGDTTNEYYIDDDGDGNLRLYYFVTPDVKSYVNNTFGTVIYSTGEVNIPSLNITALGTGYDEFKIIIKPSSYDVVSARNQIALILDNEITVNVIADSTAVGNYAGGTNYIFTSSRS